MVGERPLLAKSGRNSDYPYSDWQIEWRLIQIADLVCSVLSGNRFSIMSFY